MQKKSLESENEKKLGLSEVTNIPSISWAVGQHLGEGACQSDRLGTRRGVALPARHNDTKSAWVCVLGLRQTPSRANELLDGLVVLLAVGSLFCDAER